MKTEIIIDEVFIYESVKEKLLKDKMLDKTKYNYSFDRWYATANEKGNHTLTIKVIGTPKPKEEKPYKPGGWKE